jgi:hypothetical protein
MNKLKNKKTIAIGGVLAASILLTAGACDGPSQADMASQNSSTAADNFEVQRKIVAINTRSGEYLFFAEGRCSLEIRTQDVVVMCKHAENDFKKHYFAQSPDTFWSATQQESIDVSVYKTRIILKPEGIIPEVELSTGVQ